MLAFAVNGLCQSTGWPGTVKAMQPFFKSRVRGRVLGLWATNYQAGGLVATPVVRFSEKADIAGSPEGSVTKNAWLPSGEMSSET